MKLKDKVCLITGGSRGIGRGIVQCFAREGAKIIINYNESKDVAEILLSELGKKAIAVKADVSKKSEVDKMIETALNEFGKIDILVNNAGFVPPRYSFLELEEEIWDKTIDVNIKGIFLCTQRIVQEMIIRKIRGKIINISSTCGFLSTKGWIHYSASKSAVNSMTKTMALELAEFGISVNGIAPGAIVVESNIKEIKIVKKAWQNVIPVGRLGQIEDIARVALFLASEDTGFICGEIIYVDGGQSIQLKLPAFFG